MTPEERENLKYIVALSLGGLFFFLLAMYRSFGSDKNGILFSRQKIAVKKEFAPIVLGGPYTLDEISQHDKRDDVWIVVDDKVYDVSSFVDSHAGGDAILRHAGGDATIGFRGPQHPEYAYSELKDYYIGDVKK